MHTHTHASPNAFLDRRLHALTQQRFQCWTLAPAVLSSPSCGSLLWFSPTRCREVAAADVAAHSTTLSSSLHSSTRTLLPPPRTLSHPTQPCSCPDGSRVLIWSTVELHWYNQQGLRAHLLPSYHPGAELCAGYQAGGSFTSGQKLQQDEAGVTATPRPRLQHGAVRVYAPMHRYLTFSFRIPQVNIFQTLPVRWVPR